MKFCTQCGNGLEYKIPEDDSFLRAICTVCEHIHYENPKIIAGTLVLTESHEVLLAKRAIEPRHGFWTLPAGFMENGESTEEGALRELKEEANASLVTSPDLYLIYSIPHINQVHMFYRGYLADQHSPGVESLETETFALNDIPWEQLAFPTVEKALRALCEDLKKESWQLRDEIIRKPMKKSTSGTHHDKLLDAPKT